MHQFKSDTKSVKSPIRGRASVKAVNSKQVAQIQCFSVILEILVAIYITAGLLSCIETTAEYCDVFSEFDMSNQLISFITY